MENVKVTFTYEETDEGATALYYAENVLTGDELSYAFEADSSIDLFAQIMQKATEMEDDLAELASKTKPRTLDDYLQGDLKESVVSLYDQLMSALGEDEEEEDEEEERTLFDIFEDYMFKY